MLNFKMANRRKATYSLCFSLPPSMCISLGCSYYARGSCHPKSKFTICFFLLCLFSLFTFFYLTMSRKPRRTSNYGISHLKIRRRKYTHLNSHVNCGRVAFYILLLAWFPYYLAVFPGLYVYDGITQTSWAIIQKYVSSWHPLIHTYWMSGLMLLGNKLFNSYTAGYALYTTTQYVIFAALLACFIERLHFAWQGTIRIAIVTAIFALFPIFPIMAVSSTKDTVFSASFALCAIEMFIIARGECSGKDYCFLALASLFVACFRNNGFYALVIALATFSLAYRKRIKKVVLPSIIIVLLSFLFAIAIPKAVCTNNSNFTEMLGVPIQQICRAATIHYDELDTEEQRALNQYLPGWHNYLSGTTDPVKFTSGTSDAITGDINGFTRLWLKLLFSYPYDYLDAFFGLTNCWLCPFAEYKAEETTKPYLEFDSWQIENDGMMIRHWLTGDERLAYNTASVIVIPRHSLLPGFEKIIRKICYFPPWECNAILRTITSVAIPFHLLYYTICASAYRRNRAIALTCLFVFIYVLSCLAGPVYLVRYSLPIYAVAPLLYCFIDKLQIGDINTALE